MTGAFDARAFNGKAFYVGVLLVSARLSVGAQGTLTARATLTAQPSVVVGTQATLSTAARVAAAPGVQIAAAGDLSTYVGVTATTGLRLGVTPPRLTASSIELSSGAPAFYMPLGFYTPAFGTGRPLAGFLVRSTVGLRAPVVFRTLAGVRVGVASPFVSLPANLTAVPELRVGTQATLILTGPLSSDAIVIINGKPASVRVGSMTIRDVLNEATNTLDCLLDDPPVVPTAGHDIKVGLGTLAPNRLLFAGVIQSVDQTYTLTSKHKSWIVRASDYGVLLNRRIVWAHYDTPTSATTIARELLQYASGFTAGHVAAGLPPITLSVDGVNLSAALTQIANAIGGYWYVDYVKDVHLFVSELDPATDPHPLNGTDPRQLEDPPIALRTDLSQIRTRVIVIGISVGVRAPVRPGASVVPIADAQPFSAGLAQFRDGARITYTATAAGDATAFVIGNIPAPIAAPFAQIAPNVAGHLDGLYRWAVAFASPQGETAPGPLSIPLLAAAVAPPNAGPGIGSGGIGPLVGAYTYRITFQTSLGETLPGPPVSRTASALGTSSVPTLIVGPAAISRLTPGTYQWRVTWLTAVGETVSGPPLSVALTDLAPPGICAVTAAGLPGVIPTGVQVGYRVTFVSQDGETAGGNPVFYTPAGFSGPPLTAVSAFRFGGLYGGPYFYAVSMVTAAGESGLTATLSVGSGFYSEGPNTAPSWTGSNDTNGRIAPGWTYQWAASYFSDVYGETPLGAATQQFVGGTYTIRMLMRVPGDGSLPAGADGIRMYRRQADGPFTLNAEFRRGSVPFSYWDGLAQGEHGGAWPVNPQRAGVGIQLLIGPSPEAGILARRIYRTKAGGSEYFLVGELQSNANAYWYDTAFDQNLTTRNVPGAGTAGRQLALSAIAIGPFGTIGRRLYRQKAGSSSYFLIGELKDNSTQSWIDNAPDEALTITLPGTNRAGAGYNGTFQPVIGLPTGPPGVVARRLYRTTANGTIARLVAEIPDNTTPSFLDNVPDDALGAVTIPAASGVGEAHALSNLPTGPAGTLARRIYRTVAGGTEFRLAGQVSGNVTRTFLDAVADLALGAPAPIVATAGAQAATLFTLPVGPADVTQRVIYRTAAYGSDLRYLATVDDNLPNTTFLDDRGDDALGRAPQAVSTIGALSGSTSLVLNTVAGFPPAGWVDADGQIVSYTGITGTTLTGIPPLYSVTITRSGAVATLTVIGGAHTFSTGDTVVVVGAEQPEYGGPHVVTVLSASTATYAVGGAPVSPATGITRAGLSGAITRGIPGGAAVHTVPMLTGVSGIGTHHQANDTVALVVISNDAAAQAALAASEGGDGIHEAIVNDGALDSVQACTARGLAELKLFAWPQVEVTYATHDPQTRSGKPITINLPSLGMTASLKIMEVTIDEIALASRLFPRCTVKAASAKFSLTDLLRHAVLDV